MKIILTSIGTRGDIEPFLAIGKILKEKGHQVKEKSEKIGNQMKNEDFIEELYKTIIE